VTAGYEFAFRHYDTELARNADQSVITNLTRLSYQHELQASWKHHWDAKRRFRSVTKLSYRVNLDNASGYFDYRRTQVSEQFRYRSGPWEFSLEGLLAYYRFPIQTATDPTHRRERVDVGLTARAEYSLSRHWRLFAEYDLAQTLSNLEEEEYIAHTVFGGVGFEF
jgi:hypothetical protein